MRGRNILRNMFGLDWRSLALMRIGLALVILTDLTISVQHLRAFYSDEGVLTTQVVRDYYAPDLTLYLFDGSAAYAAALFTLEALFAVMLLVGYRTRLATIGCLFMLLSRHARNPLILFGADMVEHLALFWAVWLPLNRRYSVDAWLGRVEKPTETRYLGMASIGVVLQFMAIYMASAIAKSGPTWQIEHSAVYYSLSIQMYARPLGQWLNQYDWLTTWLTIGTLNLELYGPLLFILPIRRGWGRLLGCLLFGVLQLGFGICMQMGLFWIVVNVFMLLFLPEEFWTWFAEPLGRWLSQRWRRAQPTRPVVKLALAPKPAPPAWRRHGGRLWWLLRETVVAMIIAVMLLLNYDSVSHKAPLTPEKWYWLATDVGLGQRFDMFAPDPQQFDGWYVLRGWTRDGEAVDLLTGVSPPNFDPPESIADSFGDERWCSYLLDLTYDDFAPYRQYFAEYLERNWDNSHPRNQQLAKIEILFLRINHGPNHTYNGPDQQLLWAENF